MEASNGPAPLPEGEQLYGKLPPDVGEWLFKDKDQVLGPVQPQLLLTKLYDGELNADTPVAQEVGDWKPLKEVWFLGAHVTRAQQKLAYAAAVAERSRLTRNHLRTRLSLAAVCFSVLFAASYAAGRQLMIARPWEDKTDWLTRRPAVVALPDRTPKVVEVVKKPDPEPVAAAAPPPEDKEVENDDDDDKKADRNGRRGRRNDRRGRREAVKKDTRAAAKAESKKPEEDVKKEAPKVAGVAQELTKEQMISVFRGGARGYTQCIREEATRNPDMPGTITVEFVIRNDGTTGEFKVQEREIRSGPLAACLGKKIAALRFPRFTGERKVFMFPFKITRK